MEEIITNLKSFNRKERFYLIGTITGDREPTLSDEFRDKLNNIFSLKIPKDAFAAMDYHIDWISASLIMSFEADKYQNGIYPNDSRIITANQEDVDFIISYYENNLCHIIMLEAKAATGWTNKQMDSKAERLEKVFGIEGNKWPNVTPHFVIISPKPPRQLHIDKWPNWMKQDGYIRWIELKMPDNLQMITRCDERGEISKDGNYWRIKKVRYAPSPR